MKHGYQRIYLYFIVNLFFGRSSEKDSENEQISLLLSKLEDCELQLTSLQNEKMELEKRIQSVLLKIMIYYEFIFIRHLTIDKEIYDKQLAEIEKFQKIIKLQVNLVQSTI